MKTKEIAEKALSDLEKSLKEFGTYSFDDKGAYEVMNVNIFVRQIGSMDVESASECLLLISNGRKDGRGENLANTILTNIRQTEDWIDGVLDITGMEY